MEVGCPYCNGGNMIDTSVSTRFQCAHCANVFEIGVPQQPQQTLNATQTNVEVNIHEQRPIVFDAAGGYKCRYCKVKVLPVWTSKVSVLGWITFAVLLFCCPPICFLGLMMHDRVRQCPACGR